MKIPKIRENSYFKLFQNISKAQLGLIKGLFFMNKLFLLGFSGLTLLSLSACGEQNPNANKPSVPVAASQTSSASGASSASSVSTASASSTSSPEKIFAQQSVQLFFESCIKHAGNEKAVGEWIQKNQLLELKDNQKKDFGLEKEIKRAWAINSPDGGQFLVVSGENYCGTRIHIADGDTTVQETKSLLENVAKDTQYTFKIIEQGALPNYPNVKQSIFSLSKSDTPNELWVQVLTTKDPNAYAQASLNMRLVAGKK